VLRARVPQLQEVRPSVASRRLSVPPPKRARARAHAHAPSHMHAPSHTHTLTAVAGATRLVRLRRDSLLQVFFPQGSHFRKETLALTKDLPHLRIA